MTKEVVTENKKTSRLRRVIRYSVAVAASAVLLIGGIAAYQFYKLSSGTLFAEKYAAYELPPASGNAAPENKIAVAFRKRDFAEVIKQNESGVLSIKDIFLAGMAHLEMGDASKAISKFLVVLTDQAADTTTKLKQTTEYYLALAYLKNRDLDQAIELMNQIRSHSSHLYKERFSKNYVNRVKRLKWR